MARTVSIPPIESFGRLTQLLTVQDGRAVIDLTEEARKEPRRRLLPDKQRDANAQ